MKRLHFGSLVIGAIIAICGAALLAAVQFDFNYHQPFSHYTGMDGEWYNANDNPCYIIVRGHDKVYIKDGKGKMYDAVFEGPWTIKDKGQKRTGTIQDGGRRLKWSDGGMWTRYPKGKTHVSGTWYRNKQPIDVKVFDNGYKFVADYKNGPTLRGHAGGSHSLVIPSKNVTGHINRDANTIFWSNGNVWTRTPGGTGGGPLRTPGPNSG